MYLLTANVRRKDSFFGNAAPYNTFFEERRLIPKGQFHEVRFEAVEEDPVRQVQLLYEKLSLPGIGAFKPALQQYIESIADYQKNRFEELSPELRGKIAIQWRRSFQKWG